MFVGLPCQTASVLGVFGDRENLTTVSLICNSVPSQKRWEEYLEKKEKEYGSTCVYVNMRCGMIQMHMTFFNGRTFIDENNEWVQSFVGRNENIRPSCLKCEAKYPFIDGDLIVGDSWGIDKKAYGFSDNKVGVVLVLSDRGNRKILELEDMTLKELGEDYAKTAQRSNTCLIRHR